MSLVTITEVGGPRPYTVKDGSTLIAYPLTFKGQMMEGTGELSQKPETAAPWVGAEMDLEVLAPTAPGRPSRLKKVKAPYAGPGAPSKEPSTVTGTFVLPVPDARERAIVRQHSQHMAILWFASLQKLESGIKLQGNESYEDWLRRMIDWFDSDVRDVTRPL